MHRTSLARMRVCERQCVRTRVVVVCGATQEPSTHSRVMLERPTDNMAGNLTEPAIWHNVRCAKRIRRHRLTWARVC